MAVSLRKPLALVSILAAGLVGTVGTPHPAQANFGGSDGNITASNGTTIFSRLEPDLHPRDCRSGPCTALTVKGASWSGDGSRAIFADQFNRIVTVRWNDGADIDVLVPAPGGTVERDTPVYGDAFGDAIVWSQRDSTGSPWYLMLLFTDGVSAPQRISPDDGFNYVHPDGVSFGGVMVEKWNASTLPSIWLWDGNFDTPGYMKATDGAEPALDPTGTKLAYTCGSIICTADFNHGVPVSNATPLAGTDGGTNAVWSHLGTDIYFNWSSTVRQVPASGGTSTATGLSGMAAFRPTHPALLGILYGPSRFETAVEISRFYWATADDPSSPGAGAKSVVLSRSDTFADALGGAALAAAKTGPLLLTPPTSLNGATAAEITRVLGSNHSATVYILGSTGAISASVEAQVRAMDYQVVRLAGPDRYATSIAIADEIDPIPDVILAATGLNFPDALSAGAAAGSFNIEGSPQSAVVILTADAELPVPTKGYLDSRPSATMFGIGKQGAAATAAYHSFAVAGADRYETSALVDDVFFDFRTYAGIATGTNWPDALAGGALTARFNGPLLLTAGSAGDLNPYTARRLSINSPTIDVGLIFGGPSVISDHQRGEVGDIIAGPGNWGPYNGSFSASLRAGIAAPNPGAALAPHRKTLAEIKEAAAALR
jgi:putative cell wall-binding protein